jgi:hypothetical protein
VSRFSGREIRGEITPNIECFFEMAATLVAIALIGA